MALSAGEFYSGGQVCDSKSRTVVISETANAVLSAGETYSGGFLRDPDGRMVICQDTAHAALSAGEQYTAGDVRDSAGRIVCAAETVNTAISAGSQFSGGWLRDSKGRRIIALDTLGAALSAGEMYSAGQVLDSAGRLVLATESVGGSAYNTAILADTPAGFWPLNDPSGTTAVDASPNHNNGTYSGLFALGAAALLSDGQTGCNFTGGQMAVPDAAPLRLGAGAFSFEAWANFSTLGSYAALYDNISRGYMMLLNAGGAPQNLYIGIGGSPFAGMTGMTVSLTTATRYHLVFTSSGAAQIMYVNGVNVVSGANAAGATNSSTGFVLFANPSGGGSVPQGIASKVAVYNYVLSAGQVAAHYAAR